ncbi:MAG: radical SAM protein [Sandaracinaceae bacterium]
MAKRLEILRSGASPHWFWLEAPEGAAAGEPALRRRDIAHPARLRVIDESGEGLPVAALLRAAAAAGHALEALGDGSDRALELRLGPAGTVPRMDVAGEAAREVVHLDGVALHEEPSPYPAEALLRDLLSPGRGRRAAVTAPAIEAVPNAALFFESLMNSDMPHNDREISGGVLHMLSPLAGSPTEVVLANVKMSITGRERPILGMDALREVLASREVHLIGITLLEGYFEGVVSLIETLRELGSRAHIAVGGVMPSRTPEHVAAHLPGVSFVCRGAGEYFVPALARIVGTSDVDVPFTEAQVEALMSLDGILAIDRAGAQLVSGNPAKVVEVEDLDGVELDLSHLEPRHIEGGIEISTSRGCLHHCSFCTIIGRHRYQARSAEGIFALLGRYEARFAELFGDDVPDNAYRVHISDDDFVCDKQRAIDFFRALPESRFRLSSVQASVADLCRRDGRALLPELDPELSEVLTPSLFADHGRPIPLRDFVADHRSRGWSSYLQIGVETFSDRELLRLAKGYRVSHIRAIVGALSQRRIHMDAYFIVSNAETTAEDLIDSVEELCRLKLRHPKYFHLRFPVVPHLVSYFPSASHKNKVRKGQQDTMRLRDHRSVPGYPELDYPFVEHDIPSDPWVARAVDEEFLTDARLYTESLVRLRALYGERLALLPPGEERRQGERLLRRLDDAPRQLAFEMLRELREQQARRSADGAKAGAGDATALAAATAVLGDRREWLPTFRRYEHSEVPRLVVIPTWQCELRCRYCYIPKQDGRVMDLRTLERSIDLLLSSRRERLMLQFFGGEPLMERELIRHGMDYGVEQARRLGKDLRFVLSSNGWSLDEETLGWLSGYPVKLELSLDGDPATQRRFRPSLIKGRDSYAEGIATRRQAILASGLPYDVIMVVHPAGVEQMPENFFHIASLGFERVQINFALGVLWDEEKKRAFARGLHEIGQRLRQRWAEGEALSMINLESAPMPVRLNGEVTVDFDGTLYGGNGFLHETEHKSKFVIGDLDEHGSFDRYWMDAPSNDFLLAWSYPEDITANNLEVGRIMTSFAKWMRSEGIGPASGAPSSKRAEARHDQA